MTALTPGLSGQEKLGLLDSRYVDPAHLPWQATPYPGVEMKVLFRDEERGLMTALFRWAPGAQLPFHEHVDIEQTYVLEGSLKDEEGEAKAGQFVWRPPGSRHVATAPDGALIIAWFLKPNKFFDQEPA